MALRWGIASAGKISSDFVSAINALNSKNHQVVAVAARSKASAEEFAKRLNIQKAYELRRVRFPCKRQRCGSRLRWSFKSTTLRSHKTTTESWKTRAMRKTIHNEPKTNSGTGKFGQK